MRRLTVLAVLALGLVACGGSGASKNAVRITFGRSGGTIRPYSLTMTPDGVVATTGNPLVGDAAISTASTSARVTALYSQLRHAFATLKNQQCAGTFPDESGMFITAFGRTVTVRGGCEPEFTRLWNGLANAAELNVVG